jgi:serine/threonine-protein kinase
MGVVYKARQRSLGRLVALKVLRAGPLSSKADRQRLRNEADAAAQLDHPHIVPILEVGGRKEQPYFTMKLMEGGSLAGQLARLQADPRAAARLVVSVARAVHHAHQRGILHRDLKPSNILLDGAGRPHVTDFGLAKRLEGEAGQTQTGEIVGTPGYMAPEQASGKRGVVTTATDVYGLGAVLYALLTGRPPFQADTPLGTLEEVKERTPEPPRAGNRRVDPDLETVCLKCLEKEPAQRYASAEALAEDLERWLAGEPIQARPTGPAARAWRWCRRNPAVASLLAALTGLLAVGVVGLAAGTWLVWRAEGKSEQAYRDEAQQRRLAEKKRDLARRVVHDMYTRFARRLDAEPGMTGLQRELLEKALEFYEEEAQEDGTDREVRERTAQAYFYVGNIRHKLGQDAAAEQAHRQALALFGQLADEYPDHPDYRLDLFHTYTTFATALPGAGRAGEREDAYRRALAVVERLVTDFPDDPRYLDCLANHCHTMGGLLTGSGEFGEAERVFRRGLAVVAGLEEKYPDNLRYARNEALALKGLGWLWQKTGRTAGAEAAYRKALLVGTKVARAYPDEDTYQHELAEHACFLGSLLLDTGRLAEAEGLFREALGIAEKLTNRFPQIKDYRSQLAWVHSLRGRLYQAAGRKAEAERAFRAQEEVLKGPAADHRDGPGVK